MIYRKKGLKSYFKLRAIGGNPENSRATTAKRTGKLRRRTFETQCKDFKAEFVQILLEFGECSEWKNIAVHIALMREWRKRPCGEKKMCGEEAQ